MTEKHCPRFLGQMFTRVKQENQVFSIPFNLFNKYKTNNTIINRIHCITRKRALFKRAATYGGGGGLVTDGRYFPGDRYIWGRAATFRRGRYFRKVCEHLKFAATFGKKIKINFFNPLDSHIDKTGSTIAQKIKGQLRHFLFSVYMHWRTYNPNMIIRIWIKTFFPLIFSLFIDVF